VQPRGPRRRTGAGGFGAAPGQLLFEPQIVMLRSPVEIDAPRPRDLERSLRAGYANIDATGSARQTGWPDFRFIQSLAMSSRERGKHDRHFNRAVRPRQKLRLISLDLHLPAAIGLALITI